MYIIFEFGRLIEAQTYSLAEECRFPAGSTIKVTHVPKCLQFEILNDSNEPRYIIFVGMWCLYIFPFSCVKLISETGRGFL